MDDVGDSAPESLRPFLWKETKLKPSERLLNVPQ